MNRKLRFTALLCCACLSLSIASAATAVVDKPFTIPEVGKWTPANGSFTITPATRIVAKNATALPAARLLAADLEALHGLKVTVATGKSHDGDIVLDLKGGKSSGEAYTLKVGKTALLSAQTGSGLFYATRTLLQLSEHSLQLPCGTIADAPAYRLRGFLIDCGRKYIPISYLRNLVRIMAYYKMNTLQIHLNDNGFRGFFNNDFQQTYSAFRLECSTYPGLTARDGFYTKKEFIALQEMADSLGVEIIPEIDAPAHSLAFSQYRPELGSKKYGMDHLDLFNPDTYTFLDSLYREYLSGPNPVFRGPRVHIGTDEYSNQDTAVVEKFRYFTDHYIRYIESFGKQACVWGALTHAKGKTPVKAKNVLMDCWYNGYADPKEMKHQGYQLVSVPDGFLYIVPAAGYYYDYLNTDDLYNNWTPARIGNQTFADDDPAIEGGMFAEWNDRVGNGISVKDIHHRVFPAMQTLSAKLWSGKSVSVPFARFDSLRQTLSEAPAVNELGRHHLAKGADLLCIDRLQPQQTTPYDGVGYNYTVTFRIEAAAEAPGTELLRSQSSVLYLSDPVKGMLGFARDGYLYHFSYRFLPGETATVRIEGTNEATRLYVNGKLIDNLCILPIYADNKGEHKMNQVRTLYFPLQKAGNFKSRITDFRVQEE